MTLPSTRAMRSSSRPDGARIARRARSMGSCVVWLVTSLLRQARHLEFAMGQRREAPAQLMLQCAVDLRDCKARPGLCDPRDHVAPRIDDHRIAVRLTAIFMRAALRWREHITEVLDRACTDQQLPVRTTGRCSECRRQTENLCALRLQHAEQFGKTHVVAHSHAETPQRRRGNHRLYAGHDGRGFAITLFASGDIDVEQMNFVVARNVAAALVEYQARSSNSPLFGFIPERNRTADNPHAELARGMTEKRLDRTFTRDLRHRDLVGLFTTHDREVLRQRGQHRPLRMRALE